MRTFKIKFAYRCLLQNCQQMQNLQDLNSRTFQGFSRTFKHLIFKGLEVFIPGSSIFKDFSSMLWSLQWRSRDPHTITHTCIPAASQSQPSPLDQDLRIPSTVPSACWPAWQRPGPPISASLQYILRTLLPPPTTQNYSLRNTPHNRQLPDRLSRIMDWNFTVRMLYRNMCLWSYDLMALYKSVYYYYYYRPTFKSRLDKHWLDQDVLYNFHSELTGTGGASICMRYCKRYGRRGIPAPVYSHWIGLD